MTIIPQDRKPTTNIVAPKADRHPPLERWMDMPVRVRARKANPRMMPAAIWNGNKGPIMQKPYTMKRVT